MKPQTRSLVLADSPSKVLNDPVWDPSSEDELEPSPPKRPTEKLGSLLQSKYLGHHETEVKFYCITQLCIYGSM